MRVKLLEALAAGKAVVASPLAAAGLTLTDRQQLHIARTSAEFVESIIELLDAPARRAEVGRAARAWAESNLAWDTRVAAYERLYRDVLSRSCTDEPR